MKEKYVHIGDHRLRITGKEVEVLEALHEFNVFETSPSKETEFTVRLENGENNPLVADSHPLYTFAFDKVKCNFAHSPAEGYIFQMIPPDRPPLQLIGRPDVGECSITGNLTPYLLRFALWMAYGLLSATRQTIPVHASAIAYEDKAVLFLGESGTGKSTHTRLWQQHIPGTLLLNDDSPVLRIVDTVPYVYGSPWSGKTPCYRNERRQLAGIVRLSQAPYNDIRRLSLREAFAALYPSCPPALVRAASLSKYLCSTLSEVLIHLPVWHLACRPDAEAAQLSFLTLLQQSSSPHIL